MAVFDTLELSLGSHWMSNVNVIEPIASLFRGSMRLAIVLAAVWLAEANDGRAQQTPDRFLECATLSRAIERDACLDPIVMVALIRKARDGGGENGLGVNAGSGVGGSQAYSSWSDLQKQCGMASPTNSYKPEVLACLVDRVMQDPSREFSAAIGGLRAPMIVDAAIGAQSRAVCDRSMNQGNVTRTSRYTGRELTFWETIDPPELEKPNINWMGTGRFEIPLGPNGEMRPVIYFPREWRNGAYAWFVIPQAGEDETRQADALEAYFRAIRMMQLSDETGIMEGLANASRHPQFGDERWSQHVSGRVKGETYDKFPALYDPSNTEAFRGAPLRADVFIFSGVPYVRAVAFMSDPRYPEIAVFSFGEAGKLNLACWKIMIRD